uniref:Immunoglobulin V-set domain-containing protein n=1 Tax=Gadus morhua TaxID=8049 RepID=A0A8C5BQJ5_GADMO
CAVFLSSAILLLIKTLATHDGSSAVNHSKSSKKTIRKANTNIPSTWGDDQVHQSPPEMVVAINIKNYDQILWYKQLRNDKKLVFLGYISSTTKFPEAGVIMSGSADQDQTVELRIQDISVESSAVYFCAASIHNAAY